MGWIGVDLDGTLAEYHGFEGEDKIGAPIPAMVARVRRWLHEGREVRIVTARVSHPRATALTEESIKQWCQKHLGERLAVQCTKGWDMDELWDDRAIQVVKNTGERVGNVRIGGHKK